MGEDAKHYLCENSMVSLHEADTPNIYNVLSGQAQWSTPVIPALWEVEADRSLDARSVRSAWPTWQNSVSTKNKKLAGQGGGHL